MPLPRYHNRVPIELNINDNINGHVPVFNGDAKIWYTVHSGSFVPSGSISSSAQVDIGETSGDTFADRDYNFQRNVTISQSLFVGDAVNVSGSLTVFGRITAEEFYTQVVSSSIIYQSGSTKFGDSSDDTHILTGSQYVFGPSTIWETLTAQEDLYVNRNIYGLGSTTFGTSSSHIHTYTGSVYVQGNVYADEFVGKLVLADTASFALSTAVIFAGLYEVGSQTPIRR